jgi:hypothetical protein
LRLCAPAKKAADTFSCKLSGGIVLGRGGLKYINFSITWTRPRVMKFPF